MGAIGVSRSEDDFQFGAKSSQLAAMEGAIPGRHATSQSRKSAAPGAYGAFERLGGVQPTTRRSQGSAVTHRRTSHELFVIDDEDEALAHRLGSRVGRRFQAGCESARGQEHAKVGADPGWLSTTMSPRAA